MSKCAAGWAAGGWHAAKVLDHASEPESKFYDVELQERSPVNQMAQVARSVPSEYVRPQRSSDQEQPFDITELKPGMVVEHMLPGETAPASVGISRCAACCISRR